MATLDSNRNVSREKSPDMHEAKNMIKAFFEKNHGKTMDYVDLADALDISLPMIVDACELLEKEGKIVSVD